MARGAQSQSSFFAFDAEEASLPQRGTKQLLRRAFFFKCRAFFFY